MEVKRKVGVQRVARLLVLGVAMQKNNSAQLRFPFPSVGGQLIDWEQRSRTRSPNGSLNQRTTHGHVSILTRHALRRCFDLPLDNGRDAAVKCVAGALTDKARWGVGN